MDEFDLYRIADTISLTDAAALLVGVRPNSVMPPSKAGEPGPDYYWTFEPVDEKRSVDVAVRLLSLAAMRGTLPANKVFKSVVIDIDAMHELGLSEGDLVPPGEIDPCATTVYVEDLKAWLAGRGVKSGFFFPDAANAPDYLNPADPRYSAKLAAAVRAWQEVPIPNGKTTPKQALMKWLREHAAEFSLSNDDGNPNETGIEEVAKVANWNTGGGAPKAS